MKKLYLICLLLSAITCMGYAQQSSVLEQITTVEANDKWLDSVEVLSEKGKVEALALRMVQDTAVRVLRSMPDRISANQVRLAHSAKTITDCKPIIVVNGVLFLSNQETSSDSIVRAASLLKEARVKNLGIMRGTMASAIYGARAECGVFAIDVDKKSFKKLQALPK